MKIGRREQIPLASPLSGPSPLQSCRSGVLGSTTASPLLYFLKSLFHRLRKYRFFRGHVNGLNLIRPDLTFLFQLVNAGRRILSSSLSLPPVLDLGVPLACPRRGLRSSAGSVPIQRAQGAVFSSALRAAQARGARRCGRRHGLCQLGGKEGQPFFSAWALCRGPTDPPTGPRSWQPNSANPLLSWRSDSETLALRGCGCSLCGRKG